MQITLNGEEKTLEGVENIARLLATLGLTPQKVAVECNLSIVPHSSYATHALKEGDRVEIGRFVGGG